ncbi:AraC family transcriptional regulator [Bradyrhizobium guangzhouense]|uniref:AraC family transcriptional regulator n=2 Tax=Bradyrhizobium guangzhouense TaxID=1325095 RepID=A0ABY0DZK6_9BRAD|nr:AraC family transcriptional regulator [Bradyrhizobium guangzhouense]
MNLSPCCNVQYVARRPSAGQMQDSGTFQRASISTDDLPGPRRLELWREVYGRGIANVEIEPLSDVPFRAGVTFDQLPNVGLAAGWRTPAHYRMTKELAARGRDAIVVSVPRSGAASVTQFGKELLDGVGSASVIAPREAVTATMLTEGRFITLALSLPAIVRLAPHYSSAFGRPIPSSNAALRLLTQYVDVLQSDNVLTDGAVAQSVSDHLIDLTALALGTFGDYAEVARQRGATAARLTAVKADIVRALSRSDLSAELIATRHGISPRYVRKLFEQAGSSFSVFVLTERLTKAHRMLTNVRLRHLTIAQIAHDSGFGDLSYFNRSFRRQFGGSPSDVRNVARQSWPD